MLLDAIVDILIVIYLLFFGKIIFNTIHRTSRHLPEAVLEKTDYMEILIRFIGFWWLWRIVNMVFSLLCGRLMLLVISRFQHLPSGDTPSDALEVLLSKLSELHQQLAWHTPIYIVVYAVLAWYFLKHGQFFIALLNRLWLKAIGNNLTENPVDPA